MPIRLFAMLLLASSAQQEEHQRRLPRAASDVGVVYVQIGLTGENPQFREIRLEIPSPPALAEEEDEPPLARPVRRLRQVRRLELKKAVVERENFDRWLYGEQSEVEPKRHLEEVLSTKVRTEVRKHGLTDSQRAKLVLAGRGDIKRFFDAVEVRRRFFEMNRHKFMFAQEILCGLLPLSQIYRDGPFGEGSLFAKTLRRIEDEPKDGR